MARKLMICCLLLFMVFGMARAGYCDDPVKKLGRGLANMITFPIELPNQISKVNNSDGPAAGMTYGLLKGIGMMGFRAIVGVYEVVTFPFPLPKDYKPILTDPEYIFDEMNW